MAAKPAAGKGVVEEEKEAPIRPVQGFDASQVCVIDSGGWTTKAGFAGEVMPRSVFPTVVGQARNQGVTVGTGAREYYMGHACNERRGILNVRSPVHNGRIENWDDIERLWAGTIFDDLMIQPDKNVFLLSESAIQPLADRHARERATELFFESFAAEGLYIAVNAVLSLYASGLTTGVVVDSGSDLSLAVPIHEGYTLTRQVVTSEVAGSALTNYLSKMLARKGYSFTTPDEVDIVTKIKETMCSVSDSYSAGMHAQHESYTLPDGTELKLEGERFDCCEYLFDFGLMDGTSTAFELVTETDELIASSVRHGLSTLLYSSITQCEPALRPTLLNNIVMAGGNTLFEGSRDRLFRDIYTLYREAHPTENTAEVIRESAIKANPNRALSSWMGGSMLGMLSMFSHMLIQKEEYNEVGSSIIHIKCF